MEQNWEHVTTSDLVENYKILKVDNERLQSKIQEIISRFRAQEDSILLGKTRASYNMRRKTLEDAKIGIENIYGCIF